MGLWLKQSTAVTVKIGPFIDDTDGKTAETALTEHPTDLKLSKNGGAYGAKNEASNTTHDTQGWYACALDATDTNTLGTLQLMCHEAGFLPVFHEYMVVPANVWDSLFSSDRLQVDVVEKSSSTLDFTTTEKASINTEMDTALDTAVPGSPTANSINERIKTLDDDYTATRAGYLDNLSAGAVALASGVTVTTNNDKTGYRLSATGVDDILDEVAEGTLTVRQLLRIYQAALAGKSAGGGTTTLTFQDNADSKARITATVDADGNRSTVTLDGT